MDPAPAPTFATADLMDHDAGLPSCSLQFRNFGAHRRFAGPVATIRCFRDNALVRQVLAETGAGRVLVVDGGGSLESALVGDQIASLAVRNGWVGLVVHGAIRDSVAIADMPLGLKALGTNPRKSAKEAAGEVGTPVEFGGVRFVPGHWLYSDEDGIVVAATALHDKARAG